MLDADVLTPEFRVERELVAKLVYFVADAADGGFVGRVFEDIRHPVANLPELGHRHPALVAAMSAAGPRGREIAPENASGFLEGLCDLGLIGISRELLRTFRTSPGSLTERERKVLELRFGLDTGRSRTLEEVGKEFGVTRERIRQIEAKTLAKLRHPIRSQRLRDYLDAE